MRIDTERSPQQPRKKKKKDAAHMRTKMGDKKKKHTHTKSKPFRTKKSRATTVI